MHCLQKNKCSILISYRTSVLLSTTKTKIAIFDYIAYELLSPGYAAGQIERIMRAVRSLEDMPMRHSVYREEPWKTKQVRFLPVDNYMIFYLPKDDSCTVNIIRIIYGDHDMKRQIKETKEDL